MASGEPGFQASGEPAVGGPLSELHAPLRGAACFRSAVAPSESGLLTVGPPFGCCLGGWRYFFGDIFFFHFDNGIITLIRISWGGGSIAQLEYFIFELVDIIRLKLSGAVGGVEGVEDQCSFHPGELDKHQPCRFHSQFFTEVNRKGSGLAGLILCVFFTQYAFILILCLVCC